MEKKTQEFVEVKDLSEILRGLANKWVLLSKDETKVLAVADELSELADRFEEGITFLVPDTRYSFSPLC